MRRKIWLFRRELGEHTKKQRLFLLILKQIHLRLPCCFGSRELHWVTIEMLCVPVDEEIPEVSDSVVKAITGRCPNICVEYKTAQSSFECVIRLFLGNIFSKHYVYLNH